MAMSVLKDKVKTFHVSINDLKKIYIKYENAKDALGKTSFIEDIHRLGGTIEALQRFYCPDQVHLHKSIVKRCRVIEAILAKCRSIIQNPKLQESDMQILTLSQQLLKYLTPIPLEPANEREPTQAIRNTIYILDRILSYESMLEHVYTYQTTYYTSRDTILQENVTQICNDVQTFNELCEYAPFDCKPIRDFLELCNALGKYIDNDEAVIQILERMYVTGMSILHLEKRVPAITMDYGGGFLKKRKRIQTHKNSKRKHYRTKRARKYRM